MVREIKIVDVYSQEAEQPNEPDVETVEDSVDDDEAIQKNTSEVKHAVIIEEAPAIIEEKTRQTKDVLDMPTTDKVLQQVQCLACGKNMSAKNFRYSHSKSCPERATEEQPE